MPRPLGRPGETALTSVLLLPSESCEEPADPGLEMERFINGNLRTGDQPPVGGRPLPFDGPKGGLLTTGILDELSDLRGEACLGT